jgi:choline dehydrogenase
MNASESYDDIVGAAKMGRGDDARAASDARLRVRGLPGLRIADAAATPRIASGAANSPTMTIAEKAAATFLSDAEER